MGKGTQMSYDQNLVALTGRLTRDPESTTTQGGKTVAKFTLAVGTGKDSAAFIDCEAWEKTGELIAKHMHKGEALTVHGSLIQQNWNDKTTGDKRSKLLVRVDRIYFVPTNKLREGGNASESSGEWPPNETDVPF